MAGTFQNLNWYLPKMWRNMQWNTKECTFYRPKIYVCIPLISTASDWNWQFTLQEPTNLQAFHYLAQSDTTKLPVLTCRVWTYSTEICSYTLATCQKLNKDRMQLYHQVSLCNSLFTHLLNSIWTKLGLWSTHLWIWSPLVTDLPDSLVVSYLSTPIPNQLLYSWCCYLLDSSRFHQSKNIYALVLTISLFL